MWVKNLEQEQGQQPGNVGLLTNHGFCMFFLIIFAYYFQKTENDYK